MKKIYTLPLAALAFAAACDEGSKEGLFAPEGPSFDQVGTYGKLSDASITAPTADATITASSTSVSWTASTVAALDGGATNTHYKLDKYSVALAKQNGASWTSVSSDFAAAGVTSHLLSGLCNGTYRVTVQALAGVTPQKPDHSSLNSHNGQAQTVQFTVSGVSCDAPPANAAPVLDAIGDKEVYEGGSLSFTATAQDTDAGQSLTFSLVGAPSDASITSSGAFSWSPDNGPTTATFKVVVTDNGNPAKSDEETITVTVYNVAPTATFNAPTTAVNEGDDISVSLTNPSDPSNADVTAGLKYAFDCGSGYGSLAATPTSVNCPTTDNGTVTVRAKIQDQDGDATEYTRSVTINDVKPSITSFTQADGSALPSSSIVLGTTLNLKSIFTGASVDLFTAEIDCGSGYAQIGNVDEATSPITSSCTFNSVGLKTIKVKVMDNDGSFDEKTHSFSVIYDWTGFFRPIDNSALNRVKAGSAVPVKFNLGGNQGTNIFVTGFPKAVQIPCSNETVSGVDETVTAGESSLTYDAVAQQYVYVWKTQSSWASSCRELQVKLIDGTTRTARFQFTK